MGIKVFTSGEKYNVTVTPELKKILEEIGKHNDDTTSHSALIAEIALKANQATTYTKSEIEGLLHALPTLDLSGQIGTHNTNSSAHEDIRATLLSEIVRATTTEASKVDKVSGKGLSTNDFTNTLLALLNNQSGVNTGDETQSTIKTKLGVTTLSGSNTGDETQSTIISKLGGTGISSIGICSTASATTEKAVVLDGFVLKTGSTILVKFANANTTAIPTLNVNSTGAKAIYSEAGTAVSATNPAYFPAGAIVEFIYDGINWIFKKRLVQNYVNGTSWYRIYSDGWIEQGGKVTVIGGGTTVTLLKSFSDTNYAVLATAFNATYAICNFQSSTTLKITATNVGDVVFWEAKGY